MKRLRAAGGIVLLVAVSAGAQTAPPQTALKRPPEPAFNLFGPAQDIVIGRESAQEAERQLRLYVDPELEAYVNKVVQRLAAVAPGPKFPYQARIINASDVNAFSMPGGPIYLTRGILGVAQTEPEVAGVLAHEMAHIALRHGTDNASKVYLSKSGMGILGGLFGKRSSRPTEMINEIGGVGLNLAFLKFLDDDEYEADAVAARMTAHAGYDPNVMATFRARVRTAHARDSATYAQFFKDHPPGSSRDARLRGELGTLLLKPAQEIGGFAALRARMVASADKKLVRQLWPIEGTDSAGKRPEPTVVRLPLPSTSVKKFAHATGFFTVNYPAEWRVHDSVPGFAVTLAPLGGVIDLPNGAQTIVQGVIVNHYAPFEGEAGRIKRSAKQYFAPVIYTDGKRGALEDATDDLVRLILTTNPYLAAPNGSARAEEIDGAAGYSVLLSGLSPLTGEEERVAVFTRALPDDHIVFALCVAQARDFELLQPVFNKLVRTIAVNEATVHKASPAFLFPGR